MASHEIRMFFALGSWGVSSSGGQAWVWARSSVTACHRPTSRKSNIQHPPVSYYEEFIRSGVHDVSYESSKGDNP